tara:strand:- start:1108 stop:2034 length:927 start_codon:yes stop_codon:yes gene_type:complete
MNIKRIIKEEINNLNEAKIKVGKDEYVKLFEDKNILALKPLTHQASCKYGAGTKWCVTMRDTDKYWENYTKKTSKFAGTDWYNVSSVEPEVIRSFWDKLLGREGKIVEKDVKEFVKEFPVRLLYFIIVKKRIVDYEWDEELNYNKPIYEQADPKDPMNKLALLYNPSRADFGDVSVWDKYDLYNYISRKVDALHNNLSIFNALDKKVTLKEVNNALGEQFLAPFNFIEEDFSKEREKIDHILRHVLDKVYPLEGGEGSKHKGKYKPPTTWVTDKGGNLQAVRTDNLEKTDSSLQWQRKDAGYYKGLDI